MLPRPVKNIISCVMNWEKGKNCMILTASALIVLYTVMVVS